MKSVTTPRFRKAFDKLPIRIQTRNVTSQVRPSFKTGCVVNIVADQRTEALDDIAELLLVAL